MKESEIKNFIKKLKALADKELDEFQETEFAQSDKDLMYEIGEMMGSVENIVDICEEKLKKQSHKALPKKGKHKNLEAVIQELNAPTTLEDGYVLEPNFDFKYREYPDHIDIFDANECYNIDYLEEVNCMAYDCAQEFGYKYESTTEDDVHNKLTDAIKKDFGEDKYLEWENNVVMSVYF